MNRRFNPTRNAILAMGTTNTTQSRAEPSQTSGSAGEGGKPEMDSCVQAWKRLTRQTRRSQRRARVPAMCVSWMKPQCQVRQRAEDVSAGRKLHHHFVVTRNSPFMLPQCLPITNLNYPRRNVLLKSIFRSHGLTSNANAVTKDVRAMTNHHPHGAPRKMRMSHSP